jgi:hypothetical protein
MPDEAVVALLPAAAAQCSQDGDVHAWFNVVHTVVLCPSEKDVAAYICELLTSASDAKDDSVKLPCAVVAASKAHLDEMEEAIRQWHTKNVNARDGDSIYDRQGSAAASTTTASVNEAPQSRRLRLTRAARDVARGEADVVLLTDWSAVCTDTSRALRHLVNVSIPRRSSAQEVLTTRVLEVFGSAARRHVCHVTTVMSSPLWTDRHAGEVRQLLEGCSQPVPMFLRSV